MGWWRSSLMSFLVLLGCTTTAKCYKKAPTYEIRCKQNVVLKCMGEEILTVSSADIGTVEEEGTNMAVAVKGKAGVGEAFVESRVPSVGDRHFSLEADVICAKLSRFNPFSEQVVLEFQLYFVVMDIKKEVVRRVSPNGVKTCSATIYNNIHPAFTHGTGSGDAPSDVVPPSTTTKAQPIDCLLGFSSCDDVPKKVDVYVVGLSEGGDSVTQEAPAHNWTIIEHPRWAFVLEPSGFNAVKAVQGSIFGTVRKKLKSIDDGPTSRSIPHTVFGVDPDTRALLPSQLHWGTYLLKVKVFDETSTEENITKGEASFEAILLFRVSVRKSKVISALEQRKKKPPSDTQANGSGLHIDLMVVDLDTKEKSNLHIGDAISLPRWSIEANPEFESRAASEVSEVAFSLYTPSGKLVHRKIERRPPYTFYGDDGHDHICTASLPAGEFVLGVTVSGMDGSVICNRVVVFSIVHDSTGKHYSASATAEEKEEKKKTKKEKRKERREERRKKKQAKKTKASQNTEGQVTAANENSQPIPLNLKLPVSVVNLLDVQFGFIGEYGDERTRTHLPAGHEAPLPHRGELSLTVYALKVLPSSKITRIQATLQSAWPSRVISVIQMRAEDPAYSVCGIRMGVMQPCYLGKGLHVLTLKAYHIYPGDTDETFIGIRRLTFSLFETPSTCEDWREGACYIGVSVYTPLDRSNSLELIVEGAT